MAKAIHLNNPDGSRKTRKDFKYLSVGKDKDEAEMNLWEIVRGSTAAPTYFDPHTVKNIFERDGYNYRLIDGGVVTNNLSESIFIDALSHFGEGLATGEPNAVHYFVKKIISDIQLLSTTVLHDIIVFLVFLFF